MFVIECWARNGHWGCLVQLYCFRNEETKPWGCACKIYSLVLCNCFFSNNVTFGSYIYQLSRGHKAEKDKIWWVTKIRFIKFLTEWTDI